MAEEVIQHTHIDQSARLPELCPRCEIVWSALDDEMYGAGQTIVISLAEEFTEARRLRKQWGDGAAWHHLTRVRDSALIEKARNTGLFTGR